MVLPLVPVTPTSCMASPGRPWKLAAQSAMARRADGASSSRAGAHSTGRSAITATAPRRRGLGREGVAVGAGARERAEERARDHLA